MWLLHVPSVNFIKHLNLKNKSGWWYADQAEKNQSHIQIFFSVLSIVEQVLHSDDTGDIIQRKKVLHDLHNSKDR